jgi:hypothetical protein
VARSLNPARNVVAAALPIVLRSMRPKWLRWSFWRDAGARGAGLAVRAG